MSLSFGKSSQKSKSQSTSSSTPVDLTPKAFKALRPETAAAMSEYLKKTQDPSIAMGEAQDFAEFGQEHLTAPITANEQSLIDMLMGDQTARTGYNYLDKVIGGDFLPGAEGSNPFLQAAIEAAQRPTFEALERTLGRTLPSYATLAGHSVAPGAGDVNDLGSTPFARLAGQFSVDAAREAGDIASKMSFQGYESERGRQQEAVQLRQQEIGKTMEVLEAVALPRLLQQYGIEKGLEVYDKITNASIEALKIAANMTAATPTQKSESQSTSMGKGSAWNAGVSFLSPQSGGTPTG